ncbi:hybrid sensor histidine kinase/response regulator [Pleurocapsa sp. PCC 7319]|uniref:hybrid sensor histidine kinase/response regulator n=1 Tax=Pleurocapsa sp. PCC 7319 TaxID=118161 RepID=UPI00037B18A9|nr:hybrid sensor histidine kinase/response regulator [Pleurocapsa sp. PCC 7319]
MSFWNSLRFRMPAIVLFGVIPPMLGAIFYASYCADVRFREDAKENIASQAELLANTIFWWNQSNVLNLQQLSQQPDIVRMDAKRQKLILDNVVATNPNIYLASTVNLDGWNIARSDSSKPLYYGDRPWFLRAKAGQEISYQTLIGRTILKPAICMGKAIRQEPSEIEGVVMLCSELSDLAEQIGQLQFGETGYVILVDQTGKVLAHPNSALISGTQLHNLNRYPPVKNILEGRDGFFSFVDYKDIRWISYGTNLDNGWKITIVQREAEFFKNEQEFNRLAYLVGLVAVITVCILTWLLANYLIQPIGKLTKAATELSKGKLDGEVEINRQDELGILAGAFNLMASRLKTSFKELEHRVRQRTAELNKAKKAAEKANQTKDRFLARISHELRSPLNTIISYADILQKNPSSNGYYPSSKLEDQVKSTQELKVIRESGIYLLNLIEDILDFSKAKANKIELNPTYLKWHSFLDATLAMVQLGAQEKQILLEYETVDNLTTGAWVDQKRLQQVLINLLNNAIKFTDQGQVTLKVSVLQTTEVLDVNDSRPQQKLRFEVIDTGVGISSKHLEKIFQPFEQVSTPEQQINGTGLGLSISKQIVELMGGQLNVKSQLGVGSIFWFDISLPVVGNSLRTLDKEKVVDIIAETEHNGSSKALPANLWKSKILIIDDKEENYFFVSSILTPLGVEVFSAINGKQGLDMAAMVKPDLILLDLFMPVKTGFTLIRDLQKTPQFKTIPVILISSCNYESLKKASKTYDCQGFLTKPIDEKKLLVLLEKHGIFSKHEMVSKN